MTRIFAVTATLNRLIALLIISTVSERDKPLYEVSNLVVKTLHSCVCNFASINETSSSPAGLKKI